MIEIKQSKEEQFKEFVLNGLVESNRKKCQWFQKYPVADKDEPVNFFAFDNDKIIGGAVGYVLYGWYFLDLLWIDENYQRKRIGTELIKKVEEYAKQEGLIGIRLETWDFQAKGFYEKMGYEIFAILDDCPPKTTNYFFKKELN